MMHGSRFAIVGKVHIAPVRHRNELAERIAQKITDELLDSGGLSAERSERKVEYRQRYPQNRYSPHMFAAFDSGRFCVSICNQRVDVAYRLGLRELYGSVLLLMVCSAYLLFYFFSDFTVGALFVGCGIYVASIIFHLLRVRRWLRLVAQKAIDQYETQLREKAAATALQTSRDAGAA